MRELQKDSCITKWFDTINPSDATISHYLSAMQNFTDFLSKTPEELISEAEDEISNGVLPSKRKIKKYLNEFRNRLQERDLADKTVQGYVSAVRSFYVSFDIEIPRLARSKQAVKVLEKNIPIPTKSDLQAVLKVCDPLERALLLVGVSSGLSCIDIINLKVKQFKDGYDKVTEITTLPLRRTKTQVDFITFLSPEASQAVMEYLDFRNRKAKSGKVERDEQLEKQKVFSNNDYLFCKRNIPDSFLKTKDDNERKLNKDIVMDIYRTISEKAGKNTPDGDWNLIRSHNMRHYFDSALKNSGCDSFHVEFWEGHKMNGTQETYFRASPEKQRELYKKYIPYLTIQKEADISESPQYLRIKNENQILATETARHIVELSELQEVNAKQEKANKQIAEMKDDYMALQVDADLSSTVSQHYIDEAVRKGITEFLLSQSQDRLKKNMKSPLVDSSSEVDFMEE